MQNDTQIQCTESIFLSLLQPQAVLQKMCIGAGCVALDPGYAVHQLITVEYPGRCLTDHIGMLRRQAGFYQTLKLTCSFRLSQKPCQKFLCFLREPFR